MTEHQNCSRIGADILRLGNWCTVENISHIFLKVPVLCDMQEKSFNYRNFCSCFRASRTSRLCLNKIKNVGAFMKRPLTLRSRTFCSRTVRPPTAHPHFFTFLHVSSLKEPGCSKLPFSNRCVPVGFIPKRKGSVFKLLFHVFFLGGGGAELPNRIPPTHGKVGRLPKPDLTLHMVSHT